MKHLTIIILFFLALDAHSQVKPDARPNVIIIMADDLGYSDLGSYGGEIKTPNLDYLAQKGVRFSQFYNTSRCCPTRASLLTGLYNQRAGVGNMTNDQKTPAYRGYLTENTVTLAEVLKQAGYQTGMVGKWHVSNTIEQKNPQEQLRWLNHQAEYPLFSPVGQYPTNRGFDKFYGTIWGVVNFFDPFSLVNGTQAVKTVPKNYYHTDALNDTAVAYINQFTKAGKPFFMYVAHNAPHWPVQALPEDIEKYKETYNQGWQAIREQRFKKMVSLGLIDPKTQTLSPKDDSGVSWDSNPTKEWDARVMAVHAAMVDRMDQGIGRIINALKSKGQLDNTLIFFLSDNGASPEIAQDFPPGFDRPGETRSGGKIFYPKGKDMMPGPETVFAGIGKAWANVANTPFRYWKRESYEGGTRTPMIAFWPKGIRAKQNSITNRLGHVMDFMATITDAAKVKYPASYMGRMITPMQGKSLMPALGGASAADDRIIFNEHAYSRSVRTSQWKLVKLRPEDKWELYDMKNDGTELNDLAAKIPLKVKELEGLWNRWASENKVLPKPGS